MATEELRFLIACEGVGLRKWQERAITEIVKTGLAKPSAIVLAGELSSSPPQWLLNWLPSFAQSTNFDNTLPIVSWTEEANVGANFVLDFSRSESVIRPARSARLERWFLCSACGADPLASVIKAFVDGQPHVELFLVRELAGGTGQQILYNGRLPIRTNPLGTAETVLRYCAVWFGIACRRIILNLPIPETRVPDSVNSKWSWWSFGRFGFAALRSLAKFAAGQFTLDHWNVGLAPITDETSLSRLVDWRSVLWFPPPEGFFVRADPFLAARGQAGIDVLYEHLDYEVGKGILMCANCSGDFKPKSYDVVADLHVHVSYPYIFSDGVSRLIVPETNEACEVAVYILSGPPYRLTHKRVILTDVPLCDGTIFSFGGRWWLFGTRSDLDTSVQLFAWWADSIHGDWKPHLCNPIKCDVTGSRPAGSPFWFGGKLIRPAQDMSSSYGGAITLNELAKLTPDEFDEIPVGRITPDPDGPYGAGVHTFSISNGLIVLDGKRRDWNWRAPLIRRRLDSLSRQRATPHTVGA
jgi:hypothetical protein